MKKIIFGLILSVILPITLSASVLADEAVCVDVNLESYEITVSGELGASAAEHMVTLAVLKSGAQLPDVESTPHGFTDAISDFYLTYADKNGKYEFDAFQLFQNSGEYILKVVADNGAVHSITQYLPSKTQFDRVVNNVSSGDANEIYDTLEESKDMLMKVSDISLYYAFSQDEKMKICNLLSDTDCTTLEEIIENIITQCVVYEVTTTDSKEKLYDYLYPAESNFDAVFKDKVTKIIDFENNKTISVIGDFDKLDKTQKEEIITMLVKTERKDIENLYDNIKICTINYLFDNNNIDNWAEISDYIKRFAVDALDTLDYDKYKNSPSKSEIDKSLMGKKFKSVDELCEYINEYRGLNEGSSDRDFGSQSGGSKRGGGGGGGVSSLVPLIPNVKTESKDIFNDIKDYEWAKTEIQYLYEKGIINGNGSGEFMPNKNVTREEFVKMLVVSANLTEQTHYEFDDVDSQSWAYPYIMKAVSAGIVKGISETSFGVGKYITREDMAVLASRILKSNSEETNVVFEDLNDISDYAISAVSLMNSKQIIKGYDDGSFKPKALSTRAEAAVVIYRVINALKSAD